MRKQARDLSHHFVEILETRRFLSASPAVTLKPAAETIAAAVVTKLGPSAVEGTYKGVTVGSDGASYEIKVVIIATSVKLTVEGLGTYAQSLTAAEFVKIRKETFDLDFKYVSGVKGSVAFTGKVKDGGLKITGTYVNSAGRAGTFTVKKA
jgi:hypothetical protein